MKRLVVSGFVGFLGCLVIATLFSTLSKRGVTGLGVPIVRADGGCSVASLSGPYAYSAQGTLLTSILGLPAPAPWGEVARLDFNGAGSFSASVSVNVGGAALNSIPVTGSYTVNRDCTASFRIPLNAQDTITEAVVVTGSGQGFVLTHTESFAVVQGSGARLGD